MTKNIPAAAPPKTRMEALRSITETWRGIKQHMHVRMSEHARERAATSLSQCATLHLISTRTSVTVKMIASFLGVTSPAATQIVRELETQDMLKKKPNPHDSRSMFLCPTTAGKRWLSRTEKVFDQEFEKLLTPLTDAELIEYARLTKKLTTRS